MKIKLNRPFARNVAVDEFDVRQIKKTLNRLGYYLPYEKTGINGIPDAAIFTALQTFQKDHDLNPTGALKPGDDTFTTLNQEAAGKKNGFYIWHSVDDARVRPSHAALNGAIRDFADSPDPGEDYNCRCWAELVGNPAIEKEELPAPQKEEPKIPGTNIPDRGIPEQGYPGSRRYDPYLPEPSRNPDPYFDKNPPQSPPMRIYELLPSPPRETDV